MKQTVALLNLRSWISICLNSLGKNFTNEVSVGLCLATDMTK